MLSPMDPDPDRLGHAVAEFYQLVSPRLFEDLAAASVLPAESPGEAAGRALREWECFALYACVRGLVAAGGFGRATAASLEVFHDQVLSHGSLAPAEVSTSASRRALLSERYGEYGAIGQAGGKAGASTVSRRLGEAAARHMVPGAPPPEALVELVSSLHEAMAEGAAEAARAAQG